MEYDCDELLTTIDPILCNIGPTMNKAAAILHKIGLILCETGLLYFNIGPILVECLSRIGTIERSLSRYDEVYY